MSAEFKDLLVTKNIQEFQCDAGFLPSRADAPYTDTSYIADPEGYGYISPEKADNIIGAAFYARRIGLPFNRFMTINWEAGGIKSGYQDATGRFLKLVGDWLRAQGHEFAYEWVRELGPKVGEHVHILMAIPPALARRLSYKQRGWLKLCGVAKYKKGMIKTEPIGGNHRHAFVGCQDGRCYVRQLAGVVGYVLKGAAPEARRRLGLVYSTAPVQMKGKRCGTSQNIGSAARKNHVPGPLAPTGICARCANFGWEEVRSHFDLRNPKDVVCLELATGRCGQWKS